MKSCALFTFFQELLTELRSIRYDLKQGTSLLFFSKSKFTDPLFLILYYHKPQKSPRVPYQRFPWNWRSMSLLNTKYRGRWRGSANLMISVESQISIERTRGEWIGQNLQIRGTSVRRVFAHFSILTLVNLLGFRSYIVFHIYGRWRIPEMHFWLKAIKPVPFWVLFSPVLTFKAILLTVPVMMNIPAAINSSIRNLNSGWLGRWASCRWEWYGDSIKSLRLHCHCLFSWDQVHAPGYQMSLIYIFESNDCK